MSQFHPGDEVQSRRDANKIGTVVEVGVQHAGIQYYLVNFGGGLRQSMSELDLRVFHVATAPHDVLATGELGGYREFQRAMTYQRLVRRNPLSNNLYSLNASRTRFYPYQFKPLLKFLDSANHRLLIADEVGLGKTIEAGLILTELRARRTLQRVLVVCPSNLRAKWCMELQKRFGEDFVLLDGKSLAAFLDRFEADPTKTTLSGVVSLESLRNRRMLERLEASQPSFDLVVVDEAHHMRNFGTLNRRAGRVLSHGASAMIMLTATPIHLGNENLYSLLNVLDEGGFPDLNTVDNRFRMNEPIVRAQIAIAQYPPRLEDADELLDLAAGNDEIMENPSWQEAKEKLAEMQDDGVSESQFRLLHMGLQRELSSLNLLSHIFTRTKKRDVQEQVVERHAHVVSVEFSERERAFYDTVTEFVRQESAKKTDVPVIQTWMMQTPQRRMASCIPAMVEFYREKLALEPDDLGEDLGDVGGLGEKLENMGDVATQLAHLVRTWPSEGSDSKYDGMLKALRTIDAEEGGLKCIVFAFFKGTLRYLQRRLSADGFENLLLSGDVPTDQRGEIIDRFRDDSSVKILLSSRVGGEGLDFQFCDTVFNYDLPWNPMEVEQRIGRLDRIGQESDVIRIYSLSIAGTIEQKILERLYERIGVFERSIGEIEDILGDVVRELEWDLLGRSLTPEEEDRRIAQATTIIEKRWEELRELEATAAQLVGVDTFFEEEVAKIRDRRRYVTGKQLERYVTDFLRTECPDTRLELGPEGESRLVVAEDLRQFLGAKGVRYADTGLAGGGRLGVKVTFDSDVAFNDPKVEFLNVLHPLVQSVTRHHEASEQRMNLASHVRLISGDLPEGFYYFYVFKVVVEAVRDSSTLEVVLLDQDLNEACSQDDAEGLLGQMVEVGEEPLGVSLAIDNEAVTAAWSRAEEIFVGRLETKRRELERSNDAFLNRRLASVSSFHERRIEAQKRRLSATDNRQYTAGYIGMVTSTLRRFNEEYEEARNALERQRDIEVSFNEVAAGILEVVQG